MTFLNNLLLDARGKDIIFKSPVEDQPGRYKEKVEYWRTCTYVMAGLAVALGLVYWPLAIPPALVALRKIHLLYTKKPPSKKEEENAQISKKPTETPEKQEGQPTT